MPPTAILNSAPCRRCKFPILLQKDAHEGQQIKCPNCGTINEVVIAKGITIPTPVFVGILCFGAGVVLGPALIASTQSGAEWLAKKARERLT